jgi:hypothetical protein
VRYGIGRRFHDVIAEFVVQNNADPFVSVPTTTQMNPFHETLCATFVMIPVSTHVVPSVLYETRFVSPFVPVTTQYVPFQMMDVIAFRFGSGPEVETTDHVIPSVDLQMFVPAASQNDPFHATHAS